VTHSECVPKKPSSGCWEKRTTDFRRFLGHNIAELGVDDDPVYNTLSFFHIYPVYDMEVS
jgi:hypothetical protein